MKGESPAWVRVESGTMRLFCERCGDSYQPTLPVAIDVFLGIAKSYGRIHSKCLKPKASEEK